MLISLDTVGAVYRVFYFVEYLDILFVKALAEYSLFDRLCMLAAYQEYAVAAVRCVCAELPVVFRLVFTELYHARCDEYAHAVHQRECFDSCLRTDRVRVERVVDNSDITVVLHLHAVRHALDLSYRNAQFSKRDAEFMSNRDGAHNVDYIVASDQFHREPLGFTIRRVHSEFSSVIGHFYIRGVVSASGLPGVIHYRAVVKRPAALSGCKLFSYVLVVAVQEEHAPVRNRVGKLELGLLNVGKAPEGVEMLRANRCDKAVMRMHKIAVLFDFSDVPRAHLADEYLVRRLEVFSDRNNNTHRSVVALRCYKHSVLLSEQSLEIELNARFAVASGNSDDRKIRISFEYVLCVVDIVVVDALFDRPVERIGPFIHMQLHTCNKCREAAERECQKRSCFESSE